MPSFQTLSIAVNAAARCLRGVIAATKGQELTWQQLHDVYFLKGYGDTMDLLELGYDRQQVTVMMMDWAWNIRSAIEGKQ